MEVARLYIEWRFFALFLAGGLNKRHVKYYKIICGIAYGADGPQNEQNPSLANLSRPEGDFDNPKLISSTATVVASLRIKDGLNYTKYLVGS